MGIETGRQLQEARELIGLSQFRLAKILGITSSQLSSIERNNLSIEKDMSRRITEILSHWKKPKKLSKQNSIKRKSPQAPGIKTICCSKPSRFIKQSNLTAISFFSGCGGLSLGFQESGFQILGFVEKENAARSTYKRNFPSSVCLGHDVETFDPTTLSPSDYPDLIIGGPPCQGFSLAGKRDPNDQRNTLFTHLLRAAEVWKPKAIVMENVRLLLSMKSSKGELVINEVQQAFSNVGYEMQIWQVNALDYGVPQSRERVFVIGVPKGSRIPTKPEPTHSLDSDTLMTSRARTFRDAVGDLEPLESGEFAVLDPLHWAVAHPPRVISWLRNVPEGKSAHDNIEENLRPPSGYNTTYKRLEMDKPSSTIGTTFGMISGSRNVHPIYTRSLTIREAARLQTFPDHFEFEGTWGDIRTQIGNSVPPQLAKVIAGAILKSIKDEN